MQTIIQPCKLQKIPPQLNGGNGTCFSAISMVSSLGSVKTALLETALTILRSQRRVAALVGDLATEKDAACLAWAGQSSSRLTPERSVSLMHR